MGSKTTVILGLFLAMILLISSEVFAIRELDETSNTVDNSKEAVDDAKYPGGYGGYPGGGYGGYPGGGYPGGGYGGYPGGGYGGYPGRGGGGYGGYPGRGGGGYGGGYCRYGCCGRNLYGGGCRCCYYAGQKADAEVQAEPHN